MTSGPKRCKTSRQTNSSSPPVNEIKNKSTDATISENEKGNSLTYPVISQRGQRRYGPPEDWEGKEPPRGSEVFVAKLPRDMMEAELIPHFEKCGKIYEIRLMMETAELNKGFAFVKYCYKEDSEIALTELNNYEIRPNFKINVAKSVDNNRIFIGNVPKCFQESDVFNEMKNISVGVRKVILYPSVNDRTKNRGYGFVEFENHQQAAAARQKYKSMPLLWMGHEIKVDWAEPEPEVDNETMSKVRVLYVRNLALATTEQNLKDLFCSLGGIIERVKKMKDYAFVHFATREEAEKAKETFQGHILDGCRIDICWSKPVANREEYQQRKAASKAMLSVAAVSTTIPAPVGYTILPDNDQLVSGGRLRTAAGAQGYSAPKPYPTRPRSENALNALQSSSMLMSNPYLPGMPMRSSVEQLGISAYSQVIYATDRIAPEEVLTTPAELQCPYGTPPPVQRYQPWMSHPVMNVVPPIPNAWPSQPYIPHQMSPQTAGMVQYVIPQGIVVDNQYGTYGCPQLFPGQIMTQIPNISGSNLNHFLLP